MVYSKMLASPESLDPTFELRCFQSTMNDVGFPFRHAAFDANFANRVGHADHCIKHPVVADCRPYRKRGMLDPNTFDAHLSNHCEGAPNQRMGVVGVNKLSAALYESLPQFQQGLWPRNASRHSNAIESCALDATMQRTCFIANP